MSVKPSKIEYRLEKERDGRVPEGRVTTLPDTISMESREQE